MRVKMKVGIAGTRDGVDWPPVGGCVDLPADEAAHMIAGGLAGACEEPELDVVETAAARPAPRAAARRK